MNDLRNQLSDSAHSFDVAEASSTDLQRRAHRRSQRSNVVKATAVLAVAGVGVYGVARLSDPGGDVIVTSASPGSDSAPQATNAGPATGATPSTGPGVYDPYDPNKADTFIGLPETRSAEFVPGSYEWAAYPASSPEALAFRFDPDDTYAISTSNGAISEIAVYKQTNGQWAPTVELGPARAYARTNDRVYVIKSDKNDEQAGAITMVDLASGAESELPFPNGVETAERQVGRVTVSARVELSARGDLAAMLVNFWPDIEADSIDLPAGWEVGEVAGGQVFAYRPGCNPGGETTVAEPTTPPEAEPTAAGPPASVAGGALMVTDVGPYSSEPPLTHLPTASDTACYAAFSIDDLALTDAERAAAPERSRLWTLQRGEWAEVELPDPTETYSLEDSAVLSSSETSTNEYGERYWAGNRYLAITETSELQPLFGGNIIYDQTMVPETSYGAQPDTFTKASGPYVVTHKLGTDEWHATDLRTLGVDEAVGPIEVNSVQAASMGDGGVTGDGDVFTDLPIEPLELTSDSGEYTLSFPTEAGKWTVTNSATGEELDHVILSTEPGRIEISSDDNETVATFDVDWTTVPALNYHNRRVMFFSDDGVQYRVVDVDTVLEATGLSDYNSLWRNLGLVHQRGDQVVMRGELTSETGSSQTYVFVGTPR